MGIIRWLFGADAAAPSDPMKLDGTTAATLARSLSALPPDERGWITFTEARILFSTKGDTVLDLLQMGEFPMTAEHSKNRRYFIGGSDARIIMGNDEAALVRLWREKRAEVEPEDLSGNLVVQLGLVTEELNRRWYEANTGQVITDIQKKARHLALRWMGATLDGRIEGSD